MVERLRWDIRWERPERGWLLRCSMSCVGGKRSTGWLRRALAADRGLLWWWRAFSEFCSAADKELNHRGHRGTRGKAWSTLCSSVFSVVKGFSYGYQESWRFRLWLNGFRHRTGLCYRWVRCHRTRSRAEVSRQGLCWD